MAGRIKVVFASVLKPVDEPRMYSKMGRSLAQTYKYDVNIIGFESKNLIKDPLISFWPLFRFKRISLARLLAPLKFFRKLFHLKPELIVVTSPDLLLLSCLYKIIFGGHLIYDVQENYYRNIIWSHGKASLRQRARAMLIRLVEHIADRIIIRYTLAEACYQTECSFINKPFLILENKALKSDQLLIPQASLKQTLRLLYSGTVAESYGILDSLPLADKIYSLHSNLLYTICGHCPSEKLFKQLETEASKRPWIKLMISPNPIPHRFILAELRKADFSLVAYRLNPSNRNCMPTRIWEAIAWRKPMILRQEHPWVTMAGQYGAGFGIDYLNPDRDLLISNLFQRSYYTREIPDDIYWESIEGSWIKLVDSLFSANGVKK